MVKETKHIFKIPQSEELRYNGINKEFQTPLNKFINDLITLPVINKPAVF